jgi:GTP-binding protein LepA
MSLTISKALIFDCVYDPYKWVVAYIKVVSWSFVAGQQVFLIYSDKVISITEVWHFNPEYKADQSINGGQIGYMVTWQKSVRDVGIGDTILWWVDMKKEKQNQYIQHAIPGFKKVKPFVYAGVYPIDTNEYEKLKSGIQKLSLNDSAVEYEYENSKALWFWLRCGFLGMLHMDIIKERIKREYHIETLFTIPNVVYLIKCKNSNYDTIKTGTNLLELRDTWLRKYIVPSTESDGFENNIAILKPRIVIRSWGEMLESGMIEKIMEPIATVEVVWPNEYSGNIMELCQEYRWELKSMEYLDETRVVRRYQMPLGEIIIDFYDQLKSKTKWYATMNYEFKKYKESDLVKLNLFINNELVEAFSMIVHQSKAYETGKYVVEKLKELIPKHLFPIPLQAGIGNKIIARETISALKKDVLAKCYGWDVSRKRKLLDKQKEGKKKLKQMGRVSVPNDVFIKMVTRN